MYGCLADVSMQLIHFRYNGLVDLGWCTFFNEIRDGKSAPYVFGKIAPSPYLNFETPWTNGGLSYLQNKHINMGRNNSFFSTCNFKTVTLIQVRFVLVAIKSKSLLKVLKKRQNISFDHVIAAIKLKLSLMVCVVLLF